MADLKILETFPNPAPHRDYVIEHTHHEFTSLCPMTGHPDFADITVRYVAGKKCVELKSLKLYFHAYRNEGIFFEAVTNRICDDLAKALAPAASRSSPTGRPAAASRPVSPRATSRSEPGKNSASSIRLWTGFPHLAGSHRGVRAPRPQFNHSYPHETEIPASRGPHRQRGPGR